MEAMEEPGEERRKPDERVGLSFMGYRHSIANFYDFVLNLSEFETTLT